jgi:hypothetical protein
MLIKIKQKFGPEIFRLIFVAAIKMIFLAIIAHLQPTVMQMSSSFGYYK